MRLIYLSAGLCMIAVCVWSAVLHDNLMPQPVAPSAVERPTKGNRTVSPFNIGVPGVALEITGQLNSPIAVRDSHGNMIFQIDPANRMTIVAKRTGRIRAISATSTTDEEMPAISLPLPEGCESAFSPYVTPKMAYIIGRCIS
jgi:hypothetical protein